MTATLIRVGSRITHGLALALRETINLTELPGENLRIHKEQPFNNGIPSIPNYSHIVQGQLLSDGFHDFVDGHPLKDIILRRPGEHLSIKDLGKVVKFTNLDLIRFESGAIPASINKESTYSRFAWTRDMANKAVAMIENGCYEDAEKVVYCLADFYNRKEQRDMLVSYHWHPHDNPNDPKDRYRTGRGGHVPIRGAISENGEMVKSDHPWAHNQLDAIGAWLYVTFRLANELANPSNPRHNSAFLKQLNDHLSQSNPDANIDSILSVAFKSLNRLQCWDNFDVGPWEDIAAHKRATSIGICLKAAHEAKWNLGTGNSNELPIHDRNGFRGELDNIINKSTQALNERIPSDGREAVECDIFSSDSSLAFLLFPYNPGLSDAQEMAILKTLYANRLGVVGMTRRDKDNYVGRDYNTNIHSQEIYSNVYVPDYKAAEWCIFDPLLAAFFYNKFSRKVKEQGIVDEDLYTLAEFHMSRSIAQTTKAKDAYIKRFYVDNPNTLREQLIVTEKGRCPEAYFLDSFVVDPETLKRGKWRANENTPLLWTEANFSIAVKKAGEAIKLYERAQERLALTAEQARRN